MLLLSGFAVIDGSWALLSEAEEIWGHEGVNSHHSTASPLADPGVMGEVGCITLPSHPKPEKCQSWEKV